jgi:hypothetical protein
MTIDELDNQPQTETDNVPAAQPDDNESNASDESNFQINETDVDIITASAGADLTRIGSPYITTFERPIILYFKDHMAPFRSLMKAHENEPTAVKTRKIKDLLKKPTIGHKLMTTTSGNQNDAARNIILQSATALTGTRPIQIDLIENGPWWILTVKEKSHLTRLLDQQAVFYTKRNALTVFRKIKRTPIAERIIELKNVYFESDLLDVREMFEQMDVQASKSITLRKTTNEQNRS